MSIKSDPGLLPKAKTFSFTPSELAKKIYMYLTWCGHYFCTPQYYMKREYYPDMLLVFVRQGVFHLEYRGQVHKVQKGEAFLIDCNEPHYYHAATDMEFLYIHFNGNNVKELCQHIIDTQGIIYQGEKAVDIGHRLMTLFELYNDDQILSAPEQSLRIYEMLMIILMKQSGTSMDEDPIHTSMRYIKDNVGEKITLDELADRVGLSKYYFSHLFKAETGYSPMEYIISTRLDRAKELLLLTNMPIAEISYKVGYENPGSFTNLFIKKEGISPQKFRKL